MYRCTAAPLEEPLWSSPTRSNETVQAACRDIADKIREHACWARDGGIYWRQPSRSGGLKPGLVGPHLFPGTVGIALFLAAAGRILEAEDLRTLALHALEPLRREIREIVADPARAAAVSHPIGGLTGLGSLVYGLTRIGDLLADPSLLEDAHAVTALMTPERIAADERLDVMLGCAGTLLALLALDERRPEANANGSTPRALALSCALHLQNRAGFPLSAGFCHGAAGVSSALARLQERTGETWPLEMAERRLRKILEAGEPRIATSWCKGAPGIALGLLSLPGRSRRLLFEEELSRALEATACAPLSETDDLCCGNAGRVEVLVEAYRRLGDPALLSGAHQLAEALLSRARRNGCYALRLKGEDVLDVRFFPGLAGLGYTLLRLMAVDGLPCVAAMG